MCTRRVLAAGAVIAAAASVSGCIADASDERAVSTTAATTPTTIPADFVSLAALVPARPPAGFELDTSLPDAGAVGVTRAVTNDGGADALSFFQDSRFRRGFERRFKEGSARSHVEIWIYEFTSAEIAQEFVARTVAATRTGGAALDVSVLPGADGATRVLPDGLVAVVAFASGPIAARIESQDPEPPDAIRRAEEMARTVSTALATAQSAAPAPG
jgi:hypothetical protein